MKKIFSLLLVSFALTLFTYGATTNNTTGGTNYYQTANLIGKTLPALGLPGGTALVYVDMSLEADGVVAGLTNKGFAVTTATSWANFNTLLSGGSYTLAVAYAQNQSAITYGFSIPIAQAYIAGGGKMIFATWTSSDASIATIFNGTWTGHTNLTSVTIDDHYLSGEIAPSFTLTNPGSGWGVFSGSYTPTSGGVVLARFENGEAAVILGNSGKTLLLGFLSDTPPSGLRETISGALANYLVNGPSVPIPYAWIRALFVLIAIGVVFAKRKIIFS